MAVKKKAALRSMRSRAWRLLRLAVLWARRGGGLGGLHHLRLPPGFLKGLLRPAAGGRRGERLRYGEREFSIEDTPSFRFKTPSMRGLRLPCLSAPPAHDNDDEEDLCFFGRAAMERESIDYGDGDEQLLQGEEDGVAMEASCANLDEEGGECGEGAGVDARAEEFIAKFYAQMRLQRQISWLQFNEMMERSVS